MYQQVGLPGSCVLWRDEKTLRWRKEQWELPLADDEDKVVWCVATNQEVAEYARQVVNNGLKYANGLFESKVEVLDMQVAEIPEKYWQWVWPAAGMLGALGAALGAVLVK